MSSTATEDSLLASQDQLPLSSRYRRFIFSGLGRVFITRIISLVYIILVARYISRDVQDLMILLADGQFVVGIVATLGFSYSLTRKAIVDQEKIQVLYSGTSAALVIGLPITVILNLVLAVFSSLSLVNTVLFLLSCVLYLIFLVVFIVEDARLRSDKKVIGLSLYSVFNSLLVPAMFFVLGTLESVLIAWIFSFSVVLLYERKVFVAILAKFTVDFKTSWEIFRFGLPVYIVSGFSALIQRADTFILYALFPEGELSQYYWAWRLATTAQEFFFVLLTGAFPLITKLYQKSLTHTYEKRMQSTYRIAIFISLFIYGGGYIEAGIIILTILSDEFYGSIIIFRILLIALILRSTASVTYQIALAEGRNRYLVEIAITENVFRILLLLVFSSLGGLGMALIILFQYGYVALYYFTRFRYISFPATIKKRFLGTVMTVIIIFLIIPHFNDLLSAFVAGILFFLGYVAVFLLFRPLTSEDIVLIERVFGKRLHFVSRLMKFASTT